MNTNIDNIFKDLKKELSKNVYQELDLIIYDNDGNEYSEDDEFQGNCSELTLTSRKTVKSGVVV